MKKVTLFGSYARGNQKKKSDIDLLIEFPEFTSYFEVFGMQNDLEKAIGKNVDIIPAPLSADTFIELQIYMDDNFGKYSNTESTNTKITQLKRFKKTRKIDYCKM